MDSYTIEKFWVPRLGKQSFKTSHSLVKGWSYRDKGLPTFTEAPLTQSTEQFRNDADPLRTPIILVSAPGAVGKSTLAKEIASATGSVYINLAKADPVGANTLSGGLARSGIYDLWKHGTITALIDGLDEAILKTTQEGFEAFLEDVGEMSVSREIPTVFFGRTGVVQDAWLLLDGKCGGNVAVLEIGYYGEEESIEFAEARLKDSYPDRNHPIVDREALKLLWSGLRHQTKGDGDRFAGYAPVLQAVADHVGGESNPSSLVSKLRVGIQPPITLHSVIDAIQEREQKKLKDLELPFEDPELVDKLYLPEEQLDRLVAMVYQVTRPPLPAMSAADAETYSNTLKTWVGEHPFLDGDSNPSSAVFEALICMHALKNGAAVSEAVQRELTKGEAANPFLYVFFMGEELKSETIPLPEEQIGVIYSSIRASLAQGDTASLLVAEPDGAEKEALHADVEIELSRRGKNPDLLQFQTEPLGPICLGSHVRDVTISMPNARVEIGPSNEVFLVAPVEIQCEDLAILADKVIVDAPRKSKAAFVYLQASEFSGTAMTSFPVTRNKAKLSASWPGVENYPWTSFATNPQSPQDHDPQVDEALRRFKNFVVAFRARGSDDLARFEGKIESQRMTKGTGQAVLNAMLKARIVIQDQGWYFLNTDLLGELTGTTYGDCMTFQFGPKAIEFIQKALGSNSN